MTDSRVRDISEVNKQINIYKNELNLSQSQIITQLTKMYSPERNYNSNASDPLNTQRQSTFNTPETRKNTSVTAPNSATEDKEVIAYIKNIKKLQNSLEEKSYVLQVDYEKKRLNYENTINMLTNQVRQLQEEANEAKQELAHCRNQIIKVKEQNKQLQEQKNEAKQELAHYRKQNVKVKEENKQYKADNKIIMNQIDRISKSTITPEQKIRIMQERQMRVIKSLYMDIVPTAEDKKQQIIHQRTSDLTNKNKLDEVSERNSELKSLIRRLNQQIDLLRAQKALLLEQNKQKTFNLQKQKQIAELSETSNRKLNELIQKMGDKILSLEQINETLRQSLQRLNSEQYSHNQSFYHATTRSKIGSFYYKR